MSTLAARTLGETANLALVRRVYEEVLGPLDSSRVDELFAPDYRQHSPLANSGAQALKDFPDADGLYIGGGAWIVMPMVEPLEKAFGKPVICNMNAFIWNALHIVDFWKPIQGQGRLLASA